MAAGEKEYLLYLPLYNGVTSVEVGLPKNTKLKKADPRPAGTEKPLVFYGTSITQDATLEPFIYYHIELEQHGVLIAEGAYAESYLDLGNRVTFLEPGTLMFTSPERAVNSSHCYPPVYCGPVLDGIREELDQRAQALGYCLGKKPEPAEDISNIFPFYK